MYRYSRNINKLLYDDNSQGNCFVKIIKWCTNSVTKENEIIDNLWKNSVSIEEVNELIVEIEKVGKLSNTFSLILTLFSVFLTFVLGVFNQIGNIILNLWNAKAKTLSRKEAQFEWKQVKGDFQRTLSGIINFDLVWLKLVWIVFIIVLVVILISYWKRKKALTALYAYKRKIM